jgi:hypothetical protein
LLLLFKRKFVCIVVQLYFVSCLFVFVVSYNTF